MVADSGRRRDSSGLGGAGIFWGAMVILALGGIRYAMNLPPSADEVDHDIAKAIGEALECQIDLDHARRLRTLWNNEMLAQAPDTADGQSRLAERRDHLDRVIAETRRQTRIQDDRTSFYCIKISRGIVEKIDSFYYDPPKAVRL